MTNKINGNVGISPEYVSDWSIEEAIREIVQNYLDSRNEFDCEGHISWEDGQATVKDYGPGMEMRHLVMGISEKSDKSVGQFGEGLKLSMLVFAREGRDIEVWTKGKRITPVISYNETYETDMISLDIEDLPPHWAANHTGTSIKFECTEEELEKGKNYFIDFAKRNNNEFDWVVKDLVSLPGGQIWINGSMVGEIDNAKYSYHLSGKEAREAINRDRGSIDTEKLSEIIKWKLAKTRKLKWIKGIIEEVKNGEECWETESISIYGSSIYEQNKSLWKRAITRVFGKDFVLASDDTRINKSAEYNGATLTNIRSWKWNDIFKAMGVTTANMVVSKKVKTKRVTQKELSDDELKNLKKARKIIENNYNETGRIIIVEEFIGEETTRGMYKRKTDEIFVKRSILNNLINTVHVILHEAVHKHSGYSDCTVEFEDALCRVAVKMMIEGGE